MGGGGNKTTTVKDQPYKGLPSWVSDYYKGDLARGEELIGEAGEISDWLAGNPEFVADLSDEERRAVGMVLGQAGDSQGLLDRAAGVVGGTTARATGAADASQGLLADARSALGGDRYTDRYTDDVVETTLAGMRREADRERAARGASEAAFGGLSGTRAAVADAVAQQLTGMNLGQTEAQLRSDATRFGAEMGLRESGQLESLARSGIDIESILSGIAFGEGDALSGLAKSGMDVAGTGAQYLGTQGETLREIQEKQKRAQRSAGQDAVSWFTDVFNSTRQPPVPAGGTRTQTAPGPSPLNQALGTASTIAGIWSAISDERAKEDIELVEGSALDQLRDLETYEYRYREGFGDPEERTSGLMAQELERSGIRGAVSTRPDGVKVVNAYPVLATIAKAVRELDDRTRPQRGLEAA